ncbi:MULTISPECIES: WhiB family transcriptional regulator [unclassified Streptomyces]|uniref:WhiB family transcriptional regulator n=1 Tax=unclassified Streptomyces TaxID=2593676 RepID=UPI0035D87F03
MTIAPYSAARIPFSHPTTPTACRTSPELFTHEPGDTEGDRATEARTVCSACTLAPTCLKWALANPDQTPTGIWAGTSPLQRRILRARLTNRLGTNWMHTVAARDRARHVRETAVRSQPLSVPEARILQLDRTFNGPMPARVPPLTPEQQAANRQRLLAALTDKAA